MLVPRVFSQLWYSGFSRLHILTFPDPRLSTIRAKTGISADSELVISAPRREAMRCDCLVYMRTIDTPDREPGMDRAFCRGNISILVGGRCSMHLMARQNPPSHWRLPITNVIGSPIGHFKSTEASHKGLTTTLAGYIRHVSPEYVEMRVRLVQELRLL